MSMVTAASASPARRWRRTYRIRTASDRQPEVTSTGRSARSPGSVVISSTSRAIEARLSRVKLLGPDRPAPPDHRHPPPSGANRPRATAGDVLNGVVLPAGPVHY